MSPEELLDEFAKELILNARDGVLTNAVDGLKNELPVDILSYPGLKANYNSLKTNEREIARYVAERAIDSTLFRIFHLLQENRDSIKLMLADDEGNWHDYGKLTDGMLSSSVFTFLDKFSKEGKRVKEDC